MSAHALQIAGLAVAGLIAGVIAGKELRRRFAPKMGLREQDEVLAEQEQQRLVQEGRVRVVSVKPPWLKVWLRHMAGHRRLGERIERKQRVVNL